MQLRCAPWFFCLMKMKPSTRSTALSALRLALTAGRSAGVTGSVLAQQAAHGLQHAPLPIRFAALAKSTQATTLVHDAKRGAVDEQVHRVLALLGLLFQGDKLEAFDGQALELRFRSGQKKPVIAIGAVLAGVA